MKPNSQHTTNSPSYLEKLRNGDSEAQKRLYTEYEVKMFSICVRYASSTEEAEDLLQEGFIKVYYNIHKYRGEGNFEGWMRKIFVNQAIERFHKNKTSTVEINEQTFSSIVPTTTNVSGYDNMALKDMLKLIQTLSDGYRTVFNLYVIEGFTHREIAKLLNISENTSKSQLSRAKSILQKILNN